MKNQILKKVSPLKIVQANNVSHLGVANTAPPRQKHQHTEVCMSTLCSGEMDITPRKVLQELKCPVCKRYITPPIPTRQNGHNICNISRQKVNKCPTCKKEFLESSCQILENIIQKMKYPCSIIRKGVSLYLLVSRTSHSCTKNYGTNKNGTNHQK